MGHLFPGHTVKQAFFCLEDKGPPVPTLSPSFFSHGLYFMMMYCFCQK